MLSGHPPGASFIGSGSLFFGSCWRHILESLSGAEPARDQLDPRWPGWGAGTALRPGLSRSLCAESVRGGGGPVHGRSPGRGRVRAAAHRGSGRVRAAAHREGPNSRGLQHPRQRRSHPAPSPARPRAPLLSLSAGAFLGVSLSLSDQGEEQLMCTFQPRRGVFTCWPRKRWRGRAPAPGSRGGGGGLPSCQESRELRLSQPCG